MEVDANAKFGVNKTGVGFSKDAPRSKLKGMSNLPGTVSIMTHPVDPMIPTVYPLTLSLILISYPCTHPYYPLASHLLSPITIFPLSIAWMTSGIGAGSGIGFGDLSGLPEDDHSKARKGEEGGEGDDEDGGEMRTGGRTKRLLDDPLHPHHPHDDDEDEDEQQRQLQQQQRQKRQRSGSGRTVSITNSNSNSNINTCQDLVRFLEQRYLAQTSAGACGGALASDGTTSGRSRGTTISASASASAGASANDSSNELQPSLPLPPPPITTTATSDDHTRAIRLLTQTLVSAFDMAQEALGPSQWSSHIEHPLMNDDAIQSAIGVLSSTSTSLSTQSAALTHASTSTNINPSRIRYPHDSSSSSNPYLDVLTEFPNSSHPNPNPNPNPNPRKRKQV